MNSSGLEDTFAVYMAALAPDLAARMVEQHRIAPDRKFRLDFAFPPERLGIELEGGLFSGGAHARPGGILRDMDKGNFAVLHGWRVLRYATQHVEADFDAVIAQIRQALDTAEQGAS